MLSRIVELPWAFEVRRRRSENGDWPLDYYATGKQAERARQSYTSRNIETGEVEYRPDEASEF